MRPENGWPRTRPTSSATSSSLGSSSRSRTLRNARQTRQAEAPPAERVARLRALALDELDDDPLRASDVAEPEETLELIDLADELCTERLHTGENGVQVVDRKSDVI